MGINDLSEMFNSECEVYTNADNAIKNTLKKINNIDSLGIIGTHHLGESVKSNFNISFNSI